ncbi:caveolin-1-like [Brevipalpus obovatus]|uniref:caveolin-1-like n=1 Tax=Brevipalpus obovatus TaxID=246614 RepID=UPI003D9F6214
MDNKSGSKTNLNESHVPLLEEEGKTDATKGEERIEMESKVDQGKDGEKTEKKDGDDKKGKKKEKKEKKPKEKKEGPRKTPATCAANLTIGLNVVDRDEKRINDDVNLHFDDIIAETEVNQGFEFVWRLTFLLFTNVRKWVYCIIAAILAIPAATIWGVVFAVVNALSVWVLTPVFKLFNVVLHHAHKYWNGLIRCFLDPIFTSAGLFLSTIRTKNVKTDEPEV